MATLREADILTILELQRNEEDPYERRKISQYVINGTERGTLNEFDIWFIDIHWRICSLYRESEMHGIRIPRAQDLSSHTKNKDTVADLGLLKFVTLILDQPQKRYPPAKLIYWLQKGTIRCLTALKRNSRDTEALLFKAKVCGFVGRFKQARYSIGKYEDIMGKDDADTELQTARQTIARFHREIIDKDIDWMKVQDFGGDIQKCEEVSHQFNHTSVAQSRHGLASCDRGSSEREHSVARTSKSQLVGRSKQGPKTPGKKKKKIPPPRPSGIISIDIPDDNIICDSLRGKPGEPEETEVLKRTEDVAERNSDTKITNERKQHVITRDQKDTLVVTKHGIKSNLTLTKQKFDGYLNKNEKKSDNTMETTMVGEPKSANDSEEVKDLEQLVKNNPEKYIKCRFEQKWKAGAVIPLEKKLSVRMPNSKAWGRAFDGDTVVVELDESVPEGQTDFRYGKVVGVVERAENPLFMGIICRLDKRKDFLMTPLSSNRRSMQIKADGFLKKTADDGVCIPLYDQIQNENDPEFPFVFRETVKVPLSLRRNQLFYTRFVGWNGKLNYPECVITGLALPGTDVERGTTVLKAKHDLHDLEEQERTKEQSNGGTQCRLNCLEDCVFTIDKEGTKIYDDALSLIRNEDGTYKLAVHIADVAAQVQINSMEDNTARRRANSVEGRDGKALQHLLSPRKRNKCSLTPNEERFALSVFFYVDVNFNVKYSDVQVRETKIKSKGQLTYTQAQDIISNKRDNGFCQDIVTAIKGMHTIANIHRQKRLGKAANIGEPINYSERDTYFHEAKQMVEEIMILTNSYMAHWLFERQPQSLPFRRQLKPEEKELREFAAKYDGLIACSPRIASKMPSGNSSSQPPTINILKILISRIVEAVNKGDMNFARKLVCNDGSHPDLVPMSMDFNRISREAEFVCSDPNKSSDHHDLGLDRYIQCTSPIRRYNDLVTQRIIHACLKESEVYAKDEVTAFCSLWNVKKHKEKCFKIDHDNLILAEELLGHPLRTYAVVKEITESSIILHVLHMPFISTEGTTIPYSILKVSKDIEVDVPCQVASLEFNEHIHSATANVAGTNSRNATDPFCLSVVTRKWQQLIDASVCENDDKFRSVLESILGKPLVSNLKRQKISERQTGRLNIANRFSVDLKPGAVVPVQLAARLRNGIISPVIMSLSLVPGYRMCLEHRRNPVECFSSTTEKDIPDLRSRDLYTYQSILLQILSMSIAANSIQEYINTTIRNVKIQWSKSSDGFKGVVTLPKTFCRETSLKFHCHNELEEGDYACIQSEDIEYKRGKKMREGQLPYSLIDESFSCFVHCEITKIGPARKITKTDPETNSSDEMVRVHLKVKQNEFHLPALLSQDSEISEEVNADIEFFRKPIPERRLEEAIKQLPNSSQLVQDIMLGKCKKLGEVSSQREANIIISEMEEKWQGHGSRGLWKKVANAKVLPLWNKKQKLAVEMALRRELTVIQGPPGTGKTNCAAYIAAAFVMRNRKTANPVCKSIVKVLVCAPSNKAVDVLAGYLKKFDMKIIRMYGKSIEAKDYPVPGWTSCSSKRHSHNNTVSEKSHQDIALHHVIRNKPKDDLSIKLREFDKMFRTAALQENYTVPDDTYKEYKETIEEAEKRALQECEVILCTCSSAGDRIDQSGVSIEQLIVDEAGMCTEPETLIPMVAAAPKQVVLLGDHKQLQAVVKHDETRQRGLAISLLEKYCLDLSFENVMLTTQYRMNEQLCEFPNKEFYEGQLETADMVKTRKSTKKVDTMWRKRSSKIYPTAFCNIIGDEETLQVTTEDGSEQSKKNIREAEEMVRIVGKMIRERSIRPVQIQVLTQYRSQLSEIKKQLKKAKFEDVKANSVITFQGSENDFIILSTTRSLPPPEIPDVPPIGWQRQYLGFITDEHQINVALTRARRGLVIIGNRELLRANKTWKNLLDHYARNNCLYERGEFLP